VKKHKNFVTAAPQIEGEIEAAAEPQVLKINKFRVIRVITLPNIFARATQERCSMWTPRQVNQSPTSRASYSAKGWYGRDE
jgi:hypothetical protein